MRNVVEGKERSLKKLVSIETGQANNKLQFCDFFSQHEKERKALLRPIGVAGDEKRLIISSVRSNLRAPHWKTNFELETRLHIFLFKFALMPARQSHCSLFFSRTSSSSSASSTMTLHFRRTSSIDLALMMCGTVTEGASKSPFEHICRCRAEVEVVDIDRKSADPMWAVWRKSVGLPIIDRSMRGRLKKNEDRFLKHCQDFLNIHL